MMCIRKDFTKYYLTWLDFTYNLLYAVRHFVSTATAVGIWQIPTAVAQPLNFPRSDTDSLIDPLTRSSRAAMRWASGRVPGLQQSNMKLKRSIPDLTTYEFTSFFSRCTGASLPALIPDVMFRSRTARHKLSTVHRISSTYFPQNQCSALEYSLWRI